MILQFFSVFLINASLMSIIALLYIITIQRKHIYPSFHKNVKQLNTILLTFELFYYSYSFIWMFVI